MIRILKKIAYKYGYLVIAAAWLYTISFLFSNYFAPDSSPSKVAKVLTQYLTAREEAFEEICKDTQLLRSITIAEPAGEREVMSTKDYGLFVYAINDIGNPIEIFWNTNLMSVAGEDLNRIDGYHPVKYKNGFFELLKKTVVFDNHAHVIAMLVPVYWDYSIETNDLKRQFVVPGIDGRYNLSFVSGGATITNSQDQPVFFVAEEDAASLEQQGTISIVLRVLAILLMAIFINSLALVLSRKRGFVTGLSFLLVVVVTSRLFVYMFPFPFDLKKYPLFGPEVFASSALHPSLGDLLINTILLFWIVWFIKFNHKNLGKVTLGVTARKITGALALLALPLCTMVVSDTLSSLVLDSSRISFDVTSFFDLNIYTVVSFIIICFLLLSYFYVAQMLAALSKLVHTGLYWRVIILLSFSLFLLSFTLSGDNDTLLNFSIIAWIILLYFFLELGSADIAQSFYRSSYFIPWSIFLMASVSALLIFQNGQLEHRKRKTIADGLSLKSDYTSATILSVAMAGFSNFMKEVNFADLYNGEKNLAVKESLSNNNFQGYLNNFYTRIYTFDNRQQPLYNDDSTSYNVLKSIIANQSTQTDVPDLYYYENATSSFSYIYEKDIYSKDSVRQNLLEGHIFLVIRPREYADEAFSPQLFKQLLPDGTLIGKDYAYAVYKKFKLIKTSGNYNFKDSISIKEVPKFGEEYVHKPGYSELWYKTADNRVVVVARKNIWGKEAITFFAYLFGLLIVLVALQHFGGLIFETHFRWHELQKIFRFNIRGQIQAIIISVSIISFVIIGIAIISFFIFSFRENNEKRLMSTSEIIVQEIQQAANNSFTADDILSIDKIDLRFEFQQQILQIANNHHIDINLYDLNGNLLISSQRYVYDNAILSRKMNPEAYYSMHYEHSTKYIHEEQIVDFKFQTIYVPINGYDKTTVAYLNIPSISTQKDLKQEISNFLVTILDLNALIFIMAGAIAIWITRRITTSFTLIGDKMKAISFGAVNEEIEWKKDDELGELITEYNKMVKKLAESAQALARSEREGAWREMARQVAHEIKNPLTPMKLSIQYLQRAIDNNAPNVKDLSRQVASTLVEQIDQLSKIAGDFSQFANIANVSIEVFDLSVVIEMIVQLYSSDERIQLTWNKEEGVYLIRADRTQINRLFTNLIKNAIEAHEEVENTNITIGQTLRDNEVLIAIADNGHGIPVHMRPKIFTPNFTTKSSGTGLGLAICKGIVEKANGHIWFETKENEGTTFFVSLPLANDE
ncbi:HAMP domain-containing histidine kinase [Panacibacter sp. DH6]|uniref:histidine kinase n=1 Tax=Panacibacter microcysteis TaxID=2793269 RepID=A0A931E0T9_9BACT|nr:HAMP domain-containing sensor histidine kinase [Panacibacter microcysteis]MBG9376552.1 HAMP domain-containing histidine kinase [Panacibacter microcysteis]